MENVDNIKDDSVLKDWLNQVCSSNNTREAYFSALKLYCNIAEMTPTQLIETAEKESSKKLRTQSMFHLLSEFKSHLNKNLSPTSRKTYLAAVSSFYTIYDVPIPKKLFRTEQKPTILSENDLKISEREVGLAFMIAEDPMNLAIAIQYTSGLSMADTLRLNVMTFRENIKDKIARLDVKRKKTEIDFMTFVSPTTTALGLARIKENKLGDNDYLISEHKGEMLEEDRYMYLIRNLAKEMKLPHLDYMHNRLHSHNFRKLFYNTFLRIGGHEMYTLAEYFMGHKIDDTRKAYFKADPEKLRKEYMRFVPYFERVLNG